MKGSLPATLASFGHVLWWSMKYPGKHQTGTRTRVRQHATGGIWARPRTTAPVGHVSSSDVIASHLTVHADNGQFLLEVYYDSQQLEAALLRAAPASTAGQPTASTVDAPDLLRKLGELRDAGILSAAELEAKKAEILKRI